MLRERHVGRAADALGMSQPAVSTQLARLRGIAGDPLFVRNAQGMQPTPLAREWATPVAGALAALEQALNPPSGFDPAASQRSFIVYMTDVGQTLILNRLVSRIAAAAPGVRLRMVTAWEGALAERLDDGALDLAVGWIPQLKARKTSTLLFKDRYVGVREARRAPSGGRPGSLCGGRRAALGPPDRRRALPAAGAGTGRDLVQFLHAVRAAGRHLADRRGARPSGAAVGQPARWTAHRGTALPAARHVHPHALVGRQLARRRHRLAARTGRGQRARLRRVAGAATRDAPPRGTAKT